MTAIQSHPLFDDETAIIKAGNQPCPVELTDFQRRLDRIAGITHDNYSKVRVVWGQDEQATRMYFRGHWLLKYPFYRLEAGEGRIRDIGRPRFIVEQLHSRAELLRSGAWEKARKSHEGLATCDDLGEAPAEGFYTELFTVAYHDRWCCDGRGLVHNELCLGAYRAPNEHDLERVRGMVWGRERAASAESAPSDGAIERRIENAVERRDERWRQALREAIDSWLSVHGWRGAEFDPTRLAHGRYHFLGAHNKAGLNKETFARMRAELKGNNANSDSNGAAQRS